MRSALTRIATAIVAALVAQGCMAQPQSATASWLDEARPDSWNAPRKQIPAAPSMPSSIDPRCQKFARLPQLAQDRLVRANGWDLIGPFQGGWDVVIIQGAAGYDGMCRPLQYQTFVFVGGEFAGTLSPTPMNSRSDGALGRVSLESQTQLTAEYSRYKESDALCCPSRRTVAVFEIVTDDGVVRPISVSTSPTTTDSEDRSSSDK